MDIYPAMLNKLFGTKIKVIGGYKDGGSIFQAMESGEIEGRCSPQLTAIQSIRPQWLTEHKIGVPILISEKAQPRVSRHARRHGVREGRSHPPAARAADRHAEHGPAGAAAAWRAADRVTEVRDAFDRDHGRSGVP